MVPTAYRFSLISSVALMLSLMRQTGCGSHEKSKENLNSFVPYTYIIEYTKTSDDSQPSATGKNEVMVMPYPRLKSEDIHKKVEIFTEEGYDKGSYDHKGYDKEDKKWDDHMEYDHKSFGGSSENRSSPPSSDQIDSETGEAKISQTYRAYPSKMGKHQRLQRIYQPTEVNRKNKPLMNYPSPMFLTPPTVFPRSGFLQEKEAQLSPLLSKHKKKAKLLKTNAQDLPTNKKLISKDKLETIRDLKDGGMWSPFKFELPNDISTFISGNNLARSVKPWERDHMQSSSSEVLSLITPLDTVGNMHPAAYLLDTKSNFDPEHPFEPFYIVETRMGIGRNSIHGLAPHDQNQSNVLPLSKGPSKEESRSSFLSLDNQGSPYMNFATGFPHKTRTRDLLPTPSKIRIQDRKSSLYSRKPCLSRHLKTAHFNLDGWKPKRGPPSWYRDDAPFLGPLKGQVDSLREAVFEPVLKDALCEWQSLEIILRRNQ